MEQLPLLLRSFVPLIFSLLLHHQTSIAQNDPQEKAVLYALKATFNDPFLNLNWTGSPCYMDFPSRWFGIRCTNGRVSEISLQGMGLTGTLSRDTFVEFVELKNLSFRNNLLSGNVMDFYANQGMEHVDLSGNRFHGEISRSLVGLNSLVSLQLQENTLTGHIPEFNQSSLKIFNVSNNDLQGSIPRTRVLQSFSLDSYANNPRLCGSPTLVACDYSNPTPHESANGTAAADNNSNDSAGSSHKSTITTMFLLVDAVGLIAVVLLFLLYFKKSKKMKKMLERFDEEEGGKNAEENNEEPDTNVREERSVKNTPTTTTTNNNNNIERHENRSILVGEVMKQEEKGKLTFMEEEAWFQLNDLLKAKAEGLGKGIFGNTYKAMMMEGKAAVVVKRLRDLRPLSVEEFTRQLHLIAHHKHPNLLPLLAYYSSNNEKLIVLKYAANGNLFHRIHGARPSNDRIPFRWSARLSAARGVARALEYLHLNGNSQTTVPHGNLKSSNVLLDDNDKVLVTDYGLGSLIALPIATQRMVSYKSPEYQTSKKLSKKTDVWSYGGLLLELLTGRVPIYCAPPGINGVDLCSWLHRAVREEWTAEIFDAEISGQRSAGSGMVKLLKIAIRCCNKSPEKRPEMTEVVREVENIRVVESEDGDDLSLDQSLTDDSVSTPSASAIIGDER